MYKDYKLILPSREYVSPNLINKLYEENRERIESKKSNKSKKKVNKSDVLKESNWLKFRKQLLSKLIKNKQKKNGEDSTIEITELEVKKENVLQELKDRFKKVQSYNQDETISNFIALSTAFIYIENKMERLAKVTIVDSNGRLVYNGFVKSSKQVVNYNKKIYGFTSEDFNKGKPFLKVQEEVKGIIEGRVLIGANLNKSLALLNITHPKINSCDIVKFRPLLKVNCGRPLTLKKISKHLLGLWIQDKLIDTVEDSYACMAIYGIIKRSIKNPNPVEIKAGDDIELLPTKNKPKEVKKNKRKETQTSSKSEKPPKKEKTRK